LWGGKKDALVGQILDEKNSNCHISTTGSKSSHIKGLLMFSTFISCLSSQIWLNLFGYDHQFGYITKLQKKKKKLLRIYHKENEIK
jgi:hypothetical protein